MAKFEGLTPELREKLKDPELFKIYRAGMLDGMQLSRLIYNAPLDKLEKLNKKWDEREKQVLRDRQKTER